MPLAPEYQAMFDELAAADPSPSLAEIPVADARAIYRAMRPINPELTIGAIENAQISGPSGAISIRIYRPEGDGPFGTLVYFHGGGWVIGDMDTCDSVCRELATLAGLVVVAVDYRKAPEHVFPAAVDDCYAVVQWVSDNQEAVSGNGRIGVAGESAGGNLAAVMALMARDQDGPELAFQGLIYPVIDCSMSQASYAENGEGFILELPIMQWFWDTYCPDKAEREDPRATPIHAASFANLPPATVITAEFDILRDEGEAYAAALNAAGGSAQVMRCEGLVHDFFATAAVFECSRGPFLTFVEHLKKHLN